MLSFKKKKQYQKVTDELSGMLIAKHAPIRNYSYSTKNSRISYKSKIIQSQNQSEDKGTSSTISINELTELPQIAKPSNIIVKRPKFIPRPKQQQSRKLIHAQTSPSNLESERKQLQLNQIEQFKFPIFSNIQFKC